MPEIKVDEEREPIPPRTRWPFKQMKLSESCIVPASHVMQARWAIKYVVASSPRRFTTRTMKDGSMRVWRIL